jgi:ComF family protein
MSRQPEPAGVQDVLRNWLQAGLDLALPPVCCFCRRIHRPVPGHPGICRSCLQGLPLRFGREQKLAWPDPAQSLLTLCQKPIIYCAAFYDSPIRETLIRLKFYDAPELSVALAGLMCNLVRHMQPAPTAVVAVPLHKRREQERGYNQAELLAGLIGCRLNLPDLSAGLIRVRATRRQSELAGRTERQANLAGAFALVLPVWQRWLHETSAARDPGKQNILLVDDVLTTGATLSAAAEPFLRAGFVVTGLIAASDSKHLSDSSGCGANMPDAAYSGNCGY